MFLDVHLYSSSADTELDKLLDEDWEEVQRQ